MENPFEILQNDINRLERQVEYLIEMVEQFNKTEQFIRASEAAEYLGVSLPTIRLYTSKKKIRHYKRGAYVYYKTEDLNEFIRIGKVEPKRL